MSAVSTRCGVLSGIAPEDRPFFAEAYNEAEALTDGRRSRITGRPGGEFAGHRRVSLARAD
jgi:hypothetical protein